MDVLNTVTGWLESGSLVPLPTLSGCAVKDCYGGTAAAAEILHHGSKRWVWIRDVRFVLSFKLTNLKCMRTGQRGTWFIDDDAKEPWSRAKVRQELHRRNSLHELNEAHNRAPGSLSHNNNL